MPFKSLFSKGKEEKREAKCIYQEWRRFVKRGVGSGALAGFFAADDLDCLAVMHADVRQLSLVNAKVAKCALGRPFDIMVAKDALCCNTMVHFCICKTDNGRIFKLPFCYEPLTISCQHNLVESSTLYKTLGAFFGATDVATFDIKGVDTCNVQQCLAAVASAAGKGNCYGVKTEVEFGTFLWLRISKIYCYTSQTKNVYKV